MQGYQEDGYVFEFDEETGKLTMSATYSDDKVVIQYVRKEGA